METYMNKVGECCQDRSNIVMIILPYIEYFKDTNGMYLVHTARNMPVCKVCSTVLSEPDSFGRDMFSFRILFSMN